MFFLNQIKIKTKGWMLALGTLCGFMANIVLVAFLLTGNERLILIAGSFFGMIFFFVFTRVMVISMTNSIDALSSITLDLAKGSGDLTKRIVINSKDEIADLSQNINQFIEKIHSTVVVSTKSSQESAEMARQFSTISHEVDKRMAEERDFVKRTKDLGDAMKVVLEQATLNASQTSHDILNASETLNVSAKEIKLLVEDIQKASEVESHTAERLQQLSNDANQVKNVLTVISDIADQTNLLALNAAIEAARAGEHGRGFAVVADEVRNLAERTQKSLTEINATINVIVQNIIDASGQMSENYQFIEKIANNSEDVEEKISNTEAVIKQASDASRLASEVSQKLSVNTTNIIQNIGQIYESSLQNSGDVKNLNTSSEELLNLSKALASKLELFKI
ncbi:methyl-accepting chemotaxis protein [Sulfurospirillum sp.]|uniref:methyl-accepting chemotaxis protein n=1 Tax=Sulfurospirillum sp. TaxID=2053622 RepID=UPI002FDC86A8